MNPALSLYNAEVHKALAAEEVQLQEMQAIKEDLRASREVALDLPTRLSHHVFVPFGPHAFFPGSVPMPSSQVRSPLLFSAA
jgi:hypothetical protein